MNVKKNSVIKGRVVGFEDKDSYVMVDIGARSDCLVPTAEFDVRPQVNEVYEFVVTKSLPDGCEISRAFFKKRVLTEMINKLSNSREPVNASVVKVVKNGYIVEVPVVSTSCFLFTKKVLEVGEKVDVILTNYFGSKLKCHLKDDTTIVLNPGDVISGSVSACNDFFNFIKSDQIPDTYEANVYRNDCNQQLDVGYTGQFVVIYCDKRNIFLSLQTAVSNEIQIGGVYDGIVDSIKFTGLIINVGGNKVVVKTQEVAWFV